MCLDLGAITFSQISSQSTSICGTRVVKISSNLRTLGSTSQQLASIVSSQRLCNKCDSNEIEDEQHCSLTCPNNAKQCFQLINKVNHFYPNFQNLNITDKFKILMSSKNEDL